MATLLPTTPRYATQRPSPLRPFSKASSDATNGSRPVTATSDAGTVQHDPVPVKLPIERRCILWIHDDAFSKEEVVLNLDLFPDVKPGELLAIVPLKIDISLRDFQESVQASKREPESLSTAMQRERSGSAPQSPVPTIGTCAKHDVGLGNRYLFIAKDMPKDMKLKQPTLEVSVTKHIADVFGLKARSSVLITAIDHTASSASHVELSFKDEYLARSDMWRLVVGELSNKTVFKGQKILFMGTIKAQVISVYVDGRKVQSAFFSTNTKPIFRSGSARYILFIQMSREMWDFDSEGSGEIMFNKVVNGFLPALFKRWQSLQAKHLVSIVLFTRVEYDTGIASELATSAHDSDYHTGVQREGNKKPYKDFYRVVVSEMASGSWTTILYQLKREFKFFRRDISMHRIETASASASPGPEGSMRGVLGTRIEAEPSLAMHGNVLEAINLASTQFSQDHIDRDLMRTGISIVVITPCPGLFEVDYETLRMTTEALIGNGIGIDLVCLPKMPLHSVPIFRYRNPQYTAFQEAQTFRSFRSEESTPRQSAGIYGSSFSSLNESLSPSKASLPDRSRRRGSVAVATTPPSEWSYAIPHWLDVSFWTGASQDIHMANLTPMTASGYPKPQSTPERPEFAVRCKMYEMEMASVMENAMTEIFVTPLQHDGLFPSMMIGSRDGAGRKQDREPVPDFIQRENNYTSLVEFISGPSKPPYDRHSALEEKKFFQTLDTFDTNQAEILDDYPTTRHSGEGRILFKPGSEEAARRALAGDQKLFSTSFKDEHTSHNNSSFISRSTSSGKSKPEIKGGDGASRTRKDSKASNMNTTPRTPPRPSKFGRQISLGKFGFGIAAPKAATAEIQTEHASAATPSSAIREGTKPNNNTKSSIRSSAISVKERPSSSQSHQSHSSFKLKTKSETGGRLTTEAEETEKNSSVKPMTIKSALQSLDSTNQFKSRSVLGSVYETVDRRIDSESTHNLQSIRVDDAQRLYNSKLLAGSVPELPATLSPTTALSPWLSVLNPSNPSENDDIGPSQYRRWQHVLPRATHTNTMKWKSLSSPASVPLTTEYFPTKQQLDTEYTQKPYNISQNIDDELSEVPKSREEFLRELIGLRLSQGFQIVVGPAVAEAFGQKSLKIANVFDRDRIAEDGASVFMSMGNIIHQLSCVNETEIEVKMFVRKPTATTASDPSLISPAVYNPAIRTTLGPIYESHHITLGNPRDEYNWNYVDAFVAGFDEDWSENLRFWRARFVLIPIERSAQFRAHSGEDNEEEVRLEGIKRLTQIWQRHRVITPSERRFQSLASRKKKDPNPLDIVYKTEDPSVVVTAELETLPILEIGEGGARRGQLLETERFRKAKLDIAELAEAIQAPVERGGVRMQNRRWHFRLHYNCFIGSDMTTWLIENFEDIETREEAVEFGNMLMTKDELPRWNEKGLPSSNGKERDKDIALFVHVEKRHPFRDGQYFYQVTGEFAKQRPESRSGWFGTSRRRDNSVPSTPMPDSMMRDSPTIRPERSRSSSNHDETKSSTDSGTTTPTTSSSKLRPRVALSKVMKYDVDHRKRSYRPERINLHYDRLHNPDNCYHIRIDWLGVTAKLIEDAVESWATTAERYGLKLVEAPIAEACTITDRTPFRSPYQVNLALQPPTQQPRTYFDLNSFTPQIPSSPSNQHYYQKALMKKFNFVLDIEAARNFPTNVDVTYSWGRPDYKYTQYIHRTGVLLAQITDEGSFLLLANQLCNNRTSTGREVSDGRYARHISSNFNLNNGLNSSGLVGEQTLFQSPMLGPTLVNITTDVLPPSKTPFTPFPGSFMGSSSSLASGLGSGSVLGLGLNCISPESIKNELEAFCSDKFALQTFYTELFERPLVRETPPALRSLFIPGEVPVLGLPPAGMGRFGLGSGAGAAGGTVGGGIGGGGGLIGGGLIVGGTGGGGFERRMGIGGIDMGRRASVQVGALNLNAFEGIRGGGMVLGSSVGVGGAWWDGERRDREGGSPVGEEERRS